MSRTESREEAERGVTLMELLVAMSLLAIVTTLVTMMVVSASQTFTRQESQLDSTNQAALGMQQMTRIIRAGTPIPAVPQPEPIFRSASARALDINAYLDVASSEAGPTRITLALNATTGEIVEERYTASRSGGIWVYDSTPVRRHVVLRNVDASATPLFTYLGADSNPITIPSSGALTSEQRSAVAAVRVRLSVQTDPSDRSAPAELEATVSLPNLDTTRAGS